MVRDLESGDVACMMHVSIETVSSSENHLMLVYPSQDIQMGEQDTTSTSRLGTKGTSVVLSRASSKSNQTLLFQCCSDHDPRSVDSPQVLIVMRCIAIVLYTMLRPLFSTPVQTAPNQRWVEGRL